MATLPSIFAAIIFSTVISKGYCWCGLDSITVSQSRTGGSVGGKPEWQVTISNDCVCTQLELKLSCNGFQTAIEVDPSVLEKSGDECLINRGQPVYGFTSLSFAYAWDNPFPFAPISSQIACS